jgi:hypothetical protein
MAVYRLPFDDDGLWHGGANWDDPAGGHPSASATVTWQESISPKCHSDCALSIRQATTGGSTS